MQIYCHSCLCSCLPGDGVQRERGEGEIVRWRGERGRGGDGGGREHGREKGRARPRRQAVSDILADACQGWIRHARVFHPRCLARASIACDVEEVLWPVPDQRRIIRLYFLTFAVLYCTLQYIKLMNKKLGEYHKQHLLATSIFRMRS